MSNETIETVAPCVVDIFSGIGGFALGFERAGFEVAGFCESDEFCQRILRGHWPGISIWPDVRDHGGVPLSGHIGCGPKGWAFRLEELFDVRPDWVVIENVQHTWRKWVPELRRALHEIGYASLPFQLSARDVGACHHRRRVFVVANTDREQLRELQRWWLGQGWQMAKELAGTWHSAPGAVGKNDGLPSHVDRRRALGNAVLPQAAELIARGIRSVS